MRSPNSKTEGTCRVDFVCTVAIVVLSFALNLTLRDYADDFVFRDGPARYGGFAGWLVFYAKNWSGRLIPHAILVGLLQLPNAVFVVANSLMLALLPDMLTRCLFPEKYCGDYRLKFALFLALIFIIPGEVLLDAVFWKCASVLYLWGMVAALFAIRPFILIYRAERPVRAREFVLAVVGGIYVSGFEQLAAFLTVFMVAMTLWNGIALRRRVRSCAALTALAAALTLFFAAMPGNRTRFFTEVVQRFPDYDMLTFWDKLLIGIGRLLSGIQDKYVCVFCALAWFLATRLFKIASRRNRWVAVIGGGVSLYYTLATVCFLAKSKTRGGIPLLDKAFTFIRFDGAFFRRNPMYLFAFAAGFMAFCGLGLMLIFSSRGDRADVVKPLLYFGGGCTVIIMGFSPTVYASGERTFFIFAVFLVAVVAMVLTEGVRYPLHDEPYYMRRVRRVGEERQAGKPEDDRPPAPAEFAGDKPQPLAKQRDKRPGEVQREQRAFPHAPLHPDEE